MYSNPCPVIKIAARLHPFSHLPRTECLLPGSHFKLQIFPTLIHCMSVASKTPQTSLILGIQGPVKGFTTELDLEHRQVRVFGVAKNGYFLYTLKRHADGVELCVEKLPEETLYCRLISQNKECWISKGETLFIPVVFKEPQPLLNDERLSLGMHKAQDWDSIRKRLDLKEIFPAWMRLGQITPPSVNEACSLGTFALLDECKKIVEQGRKEDVIPAFARLFLAGLSGILVPRLFDDDAQGIIPLQLNADAQSSPIPLLTDGARLIRSLFLQEETGRLSFLPCLPSAFHCGRMIGLYTQSQDLFEFEWTKKNLRRLIINARSQAVFQLNFSRQFKSCRVRTSLKDRGKEYNLVRGELSLTFLPGVCFFFDRFQK